jgi:N-acetylneuraminate synthase
MIKAQPEFIAEIGVNHGGDIDLAHKYLDVLASSGAKIAKFQTYKADKLVTPDAKAYWDTNSEASTYQIDLFRRYDNLSIANYKELAVHCKDIGLEFMTTCFDIDSLLDLSPMLDRIKIASADITNFQLLTEISKIGKPIFLSTGASTFREISNALEILNNNTNNITLLHCVLNYPTRKENANLGRIHSLSTNFPAFKIGYSDHTTPTVNHEIQIAAWLNGAVVIEKHFTLDKSQTGNDHYHSYDAKDLSNFLALTRELTQAIEFNEDTFLKIQEDAINQARRGLYFLQDLEPGSILENEHLISLRPVGVTPASDLFQFLGMTLKHKVKKGHQPRIENFRN